MPVLTVFPLLGPSLWELLYRFPTSDTTPIQSLPFIRSLCIAVLSALLSLKSYPFVSIMFVSSSYLVVCNFLDTSFALLFSVPVVVFVSFSFFLPRLLLRISFNILYWPDSMCLLSDVLLCADRFLYPPSFLFFYIAMFQIHGDIRPENILLSVRADGAKLIPQILDDVHFTDFKVVDLGSAFPTEVSSLYHDEFEVQSLAYRAPEVL